MSSARMSRGETLVAFHPGDGAAGDGHPLAPPGVARVLDVEEPSPTPGPAAYQQRAARAHREERNREPALGRRPHPGRATRARLRGERGDGEVLSAEGAAPSAVPVLANLPRQAPPAALGCGLLHRADAHLQDAVRLLLHHARAPPHRSFQRDGTSDSAVGVASVAGGDAVGAAARNRRRASATRRCGTTPSR